MKQYSRWICVALLALLLACGINAMAEQQVLHLPDGLTSIEAEAFEGLRGITKVELPEKLKKIGSKAFANSSVEEVYLPGSLESIADDAFSGIKLSKVEAKEGTVAYNWAVRQGYIHKGGKDPTFTIKCSVNGAREVATNTKLTWTVMPDDPDEDIAQYYYLFSVYAGNTLLGQTEKESSDNKLTFTFEDEGIYRIKCFISDEKRVYRDAVKDYFIVAYRTNAELQTGIICDHSTAEVGDTVKWTAYTTRGIKNYSFEFSLYCGNEFVGSTGDSDDNFLEYPFEQPGTYQVRCTITDQNDPDADPIEITSDTIKVAASNKLLSASIQCDRTSARLQDDVEWTVTTNREGKCKYTYEVYYNGELYGRLENSNDNKLQHTFTDIGAYYVVCTVTSGDQTTKVTSDDIEVSDLNGPLEIGVESDLDEATVGERINWTVTAVGGTGQYTYKYALYRDNQKVTLSNVGSGNVLSYVFDQPGTYFAACTVSDGEETTTEESKKIEVVSAYEDLSASINASLKTAEVGEKIKWTVTANGGSGTYTYLYQIFRDGAKLTSSDTTDKSIAYFTFTKAGTYYLTCQVSDGTDSVTAKSATIVVEGDNALTIDSLNGNGETLTAGTAKTWKVTASGGSEPYSYSYTLKLGDTVLNTVSATSIAKYSYTLSKAGSYTLTARVADDAGQHVTKTISFTVVATQSTTTTYSGMVRMYVPVDASGNVLTTKAGHYELQLVANDSSSVTFDGNTFTDPVFSYGDNSQPKVTVRDGETIPTKDYYYNMWGYIFDAEISVSKVEELFDLLLNSWLNGNTETAQGYVYNVKKSPYTSYSVEKSNCFKAVAEWCNQLGFDEFLKIANTKSYKEYYAGKGYNTLMKNYPIKMLYIDSNVA